MIGNKAATEAIDREFPSKIFRYVNRPDPVPRLPTLSLLANHYEHCQTENPLGAAAEAADFMKGFASKTVDGILNASLIDDLWNAVKQRVEAHSMDNYRGLISKLFDG